MQNEPLLILVSKHQRRRFDAEAARRRMSVGALIRELVDVHIGALSLPERQAAVGAIASMEGRFLEPEEFNRIIEEQREVSFPVR